MNKTIIVVIIAFLAVCAICLGAYIVLIPDQPVQIPVDIHTPNSIIETLGIARKDTKLERLLSIRTYQGINDSDELINDLIKIGEVTTFEYLELDDKSNDYLLITPFEINGVLEIGDLLYDTHEEMYLRNTIVFSGNGGNKLPDNYSLLLRYSRPDVPEYEIKLIQTKDGAEQTATYQIVNREGEEPVKKLQYIKDDINAGTESFGVPIQVEDDENEM